MATGVNHATATARRSARCPELGNPVPGQVPRILPDIAGRVPSPAHQNEDKGPLRAVHDRQVAINERITTPP
jgi:hypothetical protein